MNANFILQAAQQPDIVGALDRGTIAAQRVGGVMRENALTNLYRTQGPGIMQGDPNALAALAQVAGPEAALGVQSARLGIEGQQLSIAQAREAGARAARQEADRIGAARAQEEAAKGQRFLRIAQSALASGDMQAYNMAIRELGAPDVSPDQFPVLAAGIEGGIEAIVGTRDALTPPRQDPISVPAGNTLVDPVTMLPVFQAPAAQGNNQAERDIALLAEIGIPRDEAIRITQLNQVSRDPLTGEVIIVDRRTGQVVSQGGQTGQPALQNAPQPAATPAPPPLSFGEPYQGAPAAFGFGGALRGAANTVADALPFAGTPFPETQQTQADFAVLRENLVRDISNAYDRQPPAALLNAIRDLTPQAGRPFQGPDDARAKLTSLGRSLQGEQQLLETQLRGRVSATQRQTLEARLLSVQRGLSEVGRALTALNPAGASGNRTSSGISWSIAE